MKGTFIRKSFNFWIVLFPGGLFSVGFYIYIYFADPASRIDLLFFLTLGIIMCAIAIPFWFFNWGAFIIIDGDSIKAKYNWFGKIDCKISDVALATARLDTLTIELKDGKCHNIMGLSNAIKLSSMIQRNISFTATESPESLIKKLNTLERTKKSGTVFVISGISVMFIIVFVAVLLTGGRDIPEFSRTDWTVFTTMCAIEIITTIVTFYFAHKVGRNHISEIKLQHNICKSVIEATPLLPGNALLILTDDIFTMRITVYGFPNDNSVYYIIEEVTSSYTLEKIYESETFDDIEDINTSANINITKKFIH